MLLENLIIMIKITDEEAARLGISSLADIEAALNERKNLKTQTTNDNAKLTALESRISALEAKSDKAPSVDVDAIVAKAVAQADVNANAISAKAVSAAIARAGQSGLAPNKQEAEQNDLNQAAAVDQNDPDAIWNKDANLRAEFGNRKETWLAYNKAMSNGRIVALSTVQSN